MRKKHSLDSMSKRNKKTANIAKKWVALTLSAGLILGLAACGNPNESGDRVGSAAGEGSNKELTEITFVLDWTPNTNHTGIYVADALGYFEAAGLDVTIVQPPEDGAEIMVGSGKAQFGVSFQDYLVPLFANDTGLSIEACAAILQHNTSGIISRAGEGMDTPKGMEGKKYATWDLDLEKATIKHVVTADGGDYNKVELIPSTVTDEVTALLSKQVDAIWVYYGWAGIACEVAGLETDYFNFADISPELDFYSPIIIGNGDWMSENPDTAKAFLAAVKDGYTYAIDNPEAAADILCEAAPELSKDLVVASQKWMADQYKAEVAQWGYIDAARWNAFFAWVNENGLSEKAVPLDTGFTNEYLPE